MRGWARHDVARHGSTCSEYAVWQDGPGRDGARSDTVRHGWHHSLVASLGSARQYPARQGRTRLGKVRRGMEVSLCIHRDWRGLAKLGTAMLGLAGFGVMWFGGAWQGIDKWPIQLT